MPSLMTRVLATPRSRFAVARSPRPDGAARAVVARAARPEHRERADARAAPPLNRRAAVLGTLSAAAAAAGTLTFPRVSLADDAADSSPAEPPSPPPRRERKRVIVTGANSGIGFDAAAKLAASGNDVVLACRTEAKAREAIARIEADASSAGVALPLRGALIPAECDLCDLSSVRRFADAVSSSGAPVDVLALNAGIQYAGDPVVHRTRDGFEMTFGTNHLGHFLLANLLLPTMERSFATAPGGARPRVIVTASEVHDPSSPGGNVGLGAGLGDLAGLERDGAAFEMLGGGAYDGDKAYKDSKLCNVLFAKELERRLERAGSPVVVNAFGPGLITRTGFFRYQNPLFVKLFDFATNDIFHVAETVDGGGDCLVYMIQSPELEGVGGVYLNNGIAPGVGKTGHKFEIGEVSEEGRDEVEAAALWKASEKLVGLAA